MMRCIIQWKKVGCHRLDGHTDPSKCENRARILQEFASPAPWNVIGGDQEESVRPKFFAELSHAVVKEVMVNWVARVHSPSFLHKLDVVRPTHMNSDKSQLFATCLV